MSTTSAYRNGNAFDKDVLSHKDARVCNGVPIFNPALLNLKFTAPCFITP